MSAAPRIYVACLASYNSGILPALGSPGLSVTPIHRILTDLPFGEYLVRAFSGPLSRSVLDFGNPDSVDERFL